MSKLEKLADAQHEIWSHWMRWFYANNTAENNERWYRQMNTPYADLTESERESDRKVVREFMAFALADNEEIQRLRKALAFAKSTIKSGEPWGDECERILLLEVK